MAAAASAYVATYPTVESRQEAAALVAEDRGLAILFGPISRISTVGGYTVYENFVFLTSVGAVWALLAGTRVLRGEEDAGRWQLVLAGATRATRATLDTLLALAAAIGAFTSQLGRTRRAATGLGMLFLACTFVLRMVADSGPGTAWVRWTTPFGWAEHIAPYTENDVRPLAVGIVAVLALGAAATVLAGRRDVGDGVLSSADTSDVRPFGLRSALGLATRLELGVHGGFLEQFLGDMLGAGLNVVPTALLALGIDAVMVALAPRIAGRTVYVVVVWSLFADVLAPYSHASSGLAELSLFHQMALVPGSEPATSTIVATITIALGLCAAAVLLFRHRDLRSA